MYHVLAMGKYRLKLLTCLMCTDCHDNILADFLFDLVHLTFLNPEKRLKPRDRSSLLCIFVLSLYIYVYI